MGSSRLPKNERLLKRGDFVNLNRGGSRHYTEHFVVIYKKNSLGITRLGITAGKRVGKAFKRNRIRRLIREFFRLNKPDLIQGYDINIIVKSDMSHLDGQKIKDELGSVISTKKEPS
jgi:ribonuclease P protein component